MSAVSFMRLFKDVYKYQSNLVFEAVLVTHRLKVSNDYIVDTLVKIIQF